MTSFVLNYAVSGTTSTSKSKTDAKKRNLNHGAFGEITGTLQQMGSKQVPLNMKPVPKMKKKQPVYGS